MQKERESQKGNEVQKEREIQNQREKQNGREKQNESEKQQRVEKQERHMSGFQIRLVIATFAFLIILALQQLDIGKQWVRTLGVERIITSNEDIYRLEDECVLWYNSLVNEK